MIPNQQGNNLKKKLNNEETNETTSIVAWLGLILGFIAILIAIAIIAISKTYTEQYYDTGYYGMQKTYSQWVPWLPIIPANSTGSAYSIAPTASQSALITAGNIKAQIVTFPPPNPDEYISSYMAVSQGNRNQFYGYDPNKSNGALPALIYTNSTSMVFVVDCSPYTYDSCIVTVGCMGNSGGTNAPFGLYVTATYSKLKTTNANGTPLISNLTANPGAASGTSPPYYEDIAIGASNSVAYFSPMSTTSAMVASAVNSTTTT